MADTPPPDTSHAHSRPAGAAGNGLFAAKAFVAGDLVLRVEREVLSVIDSPALTTVCEACFLTSVDEWVGGGGDGEGEGRVELMKCGGCGVVRFCGKVGE